MKIDVIVTCLGKAPGEGYFLLTCLDNFKNLNFCTTRKLNVENFDICYISYFILFICHMTVQPQTSYMAKLLYPMPDT